VRRIINLILFCLVTLGSTQVYGANSLLSLKEEVLRVESVSEAKKLADRLMKLARGDLAELSAKDFVLIADSYGALVSRTREIGGSGVDFKKLMDRAETLRNRCREKVRALERETGDDEVRLEALYRSDIWHDINYALSAFGYWRAWALLGIAHGKTGERDQVSWLNKAESGFQASSVRILYPGIVYGSWLGMGYVAQARGDSATAEKRFSRLVQALVSDPTNPVREIAESELTLLAIRRGEITPAKAMKGTPLTPSMANVYLEEAFVLLQQQRDTSTGAIEAGARLKKLIAEGYLNTALANRILSYRDEIVGQDLGVFSLYVDAEFAYAYQQYDTTVLKYRDFEKNGGLKMLINLRTLQYHYTVALLKIHQYHQAMTEAEKLSQQSDLPPAVVAALPKLSFLIARALHQQKGSNRNRVRVLRSAKHFLTKSPGDADIGAAHLALGELSFDPDRAKHHMQQARRDSSLKGSIALTGLKRTINAFNLATAAGDYPAQRRHAKQVLKNLQDLPRNMRKKLWVRAVTLQMQTVLDQNLEEVLKEIENIYTMAAKDQNLQLDDSAKRVLLWSKLRALDKAGKQQQLLLFIGSLVGPGMDSAVQKEVYQFLIEKERLGQFAQLAELAEAFYPALEGQTQDQRQLRLLQIRVATALGQQIEAFNMAKAMIREFPNSGDAWVTYAETAEAIDDTFTAERAWAKITSAQPDGSPRWREAMGRRIELLAGSGDRIEDLCAVINEARRYQHLAAKVEQLELRERSEQYKCVR